MADKNLPIKFFQKRKKDEQNTEAGGGKPPKWVLKGRALVKHSRELQQYLGKLENRVIKKKKHNNSLPTLIKAKLNKDATAKSHRSDIVSLFNVNNKNNVIGFVGFNEILLKIENDKDLNDIENSFKRAEESAVVASIAKGVSGIKEFGDVSPVTNLELEGETVFKVKLADYNDAEINSKAIELFEEICKQQNIKLANCNYTHDRNIYRIEAASMDGINEILEFEGLFSIEDMPTYSLTLDGLEHDEEIVFKKPVKNKTYPLVGVLDTGIERISQLDPWIISDSETNYPIEYTNKTHGTAVTSILIHGDELEGKEYTGTEGCNVMEACVFPDLTKIGIRENELIVQIENCVRKYAPKIKIWNLSLGTSNESSTDEFSDFAKALDNLQKQCDILIVKSVGNCENFKVGKPRQRVSKSADSLLSLVVGSLAHEKGKHDLDDINNPSPFTRTGPGPCFVHKPDLVHMGGNAGMYAGQPIYTGVKCLGLNGKVARRPGTSFSTPRVTALSAGIQHSLDIEFDRLLLKGLLIHNAKYPVEMQMDIVDKIRLAGFGMPTALKNTLFNDIDESTIILRDRLDRGHFINMLDFPYPQSMIDENGYYYGELTVTLITDPILEPKQQGGEYCQSNIEVILGTFDYKKERDTSKRTIKNEIGPEGGRNLLSDKYYSKNIMKALDNTFRNERLLIAYERKYHPVKKWVINLAELTTKNRDKCIKAPKQWYLNLKGFYRDHTEKKYAKEGKTPNQKFCLLITIKDPRKRGIIYNEVTQQLNTFNFVQSNIKLSDHVQIKLRK